MSKPRLLDAFCGAGGAAKGYSDAGFDVTGVDCRVQPRYPFTFVQADALDYIAEHGHKYDAIHASPPCQAFTRYQRRPDHVKPSADLIGPTRCALSSAGVPWVIENVETAPLHAPLMLCGSMFDPLLDVRRHRFFESSIALDAPSWPCRHKLWAPRYPSATNRKPNSRLTAEIGSWDLPLSEQHRAMGGCEWMRVEELSNAIPPAYTRFIGEQLLRALTSTGVAA